MRRAVALVLLSAGTHDGGASPAALTTDSVTGRWIMSITAPDRRQVAVRMTIQARDAQWTAYSRPGAARAFVSTPKYLMGRLLGKVPGRGALAYVERGTVSSIAGKHLLRGRLRSPILGTYHMVGELAAGQITGTLHRDSLGAPVGTFAAARDTSAEPLRDYPALAANVRQKLESHLYDPRLVRTPRFRRFLDGVQSDLAGARDDLDALGSFYARVRHVGTSHINLTRDPVLAAMPLDSLVTRVLAPPDSLVRLSFLVPGVAYLQVRKWDQVAQAIDRAFIRIDSAAAHTLILDIRANGGGDNSAGAPLAHLLRDSSTVGVFLGRKWYATHERPPSSAERRSLPVLTRDTGIDILHAIREQGSVVAVAAPRAPYFGGRVFVFTSRGTASASEPLAHHLRVTGRATLIGERTAGAMLTALPHDAGQGWVIVLPEADYVTADGTRLEGTGVLPHIATSASEAMIAAGREIAREHPGAGATIQGQAYAALARWTAADSAYAAALRLGADSLIALIGRGRALAELQRWDEAFAELERALAIEPRSSAALYLFGRASAVSGRRLEAGARSLLEYLRLPPVPGVGSPAAAHWRLGMIEGARGDSGAARRHYEEALRLDPRLTEARAALKALGGNPPD